MYRCRRSIAIFLSLAVVASVCIFTVSAEENSEFYIRYQYYISSSSSWSSTYTRPISESFLTGTGYTQIRIIGIQYRPTDRNTPDNVFLTFRLSGYNSAGQAMQYDIGNATTEIPCVIDSSKIRYISANYSPAGRGSELDLDGYVPVSKSINFFIRFGTVQRDVLPVLNIDFSTPLVVKTLNNLTFWPYIDNIYFDVHNQNIIDFYPDSLSLMSGMYGILNSFSNSFLVNTYSWDQISWDDQNNEFTVTSNTGNWLDAVIGTIKSLNADAEAQAAQQQKANDRGAGDALDNAYEHSNFWDLLHFTDFSDFGDYDDDALEDLADDSWLAWFSNMTKDDLDTVPRTRDNNDGYIDFYSMHMEEIEESILGLIGGND